jgi:cation-transporting ATPase 13A2
MSRFSSHVKLWRNGAWTYHKSEDMVPGDIMDIEIEQGTIMPCDAVLLQGDCIFNESMLTGESLPVSKSPISDNELQCLNFDSEEPASSPRMAFYFLFAGTKIIRVRHSQAQKSIVDSYTPDSLKRGAIALVVRTGFNTSKGSLIRSILFPRPNNFRFYQDSFRFIGVLAFISLLGFLVSFQFFIQAGVSWRVIVIRALDLITIAVPPALPATMAIGTSFAISRLRKWSIFCTSPPRVNICGKLNVMCFDKTGTLTEEGLDVLGVRLSSANQENEDFNRTLNDGRSSARFSQLYDNLESIVSKPVSMQLKNSMDRYSSSPRSVGHGRIETPLIKLFKQTSNTVHETCIGFPLMICAMATCHSIKIVHGEKMGDPLDLKMLEFTEWHLEEDFSAEKAITNAVSFMKVYPPWLPEKALQETVKMGLEIVKSFEFLSTLRRMSVIVSKIGVSTAQEYTVFVKGAPETMYRICQPKSSFLL